ncbi:hypothetical protein ZHAS_00015846 [Anopheles sinensis]|uniref:Uncharacterized protein n=1 Tax=Anopheles sinensis TaxID=74873 RepID=A0A084WC31_ANOSI|nr:hypothetical protein ZHAS_00015846 [Anopheles sinensis]
MVRVGLYGYDLATVFLPISDADGCSERTKKAAPKNPSEDLHLSERAVRSWKRMNSVPENRSSVTERKFAVVMNAGGGKFAVHRRQCHRYRRVQSGERYSGHTGKRQLDDDLSGHWLS